MVVRHAAYIKEAWSSKWAFIIAATASAVGLGNIWRFPYVVASNGGGTFFLAYLLSLIVIGLPLMMLEFTVGNRMRITAVKTFNKLNKKYALFSFIPLIFNIIVLSYYVVITGWTLSFFTMSLTGTAMPFSEYSESFLSIPATAVVMLLVFIIMKVEITRGLERVNKYLFPVFMLSLLALLAGAVGIYGLEGGLSVYTQFNLGGLLNFEMWAVAFTQAFFSLGVGWCIMLTYASYSKRKTNMKNSAIIVSISDTLVAFLGGLLIFTIAAGNGISVNSGPELAFVTLPAVLGQVPYASMVLPVFFFLLFSAAITSVVSMIEVPITMMEDLLSNSRKDAALIAVLLVSLLAVPSALSYSGQNLSIMGMKFLDFLDGVVISRFAPLAILVTEVYLAWGYRPLKKEIERQFNNGFAEYYMILVRYVIPAILSIVFVLQFI
ncbi:sodium-dependent transporter [Candidatus Micrarchaeota archaeon]|nr:sodium-dependent transporter [Candidatus Micrarchaeota archaeon]